MNSATTTHKIAPWFSFTAVISNKISKNGQHGY